MCGVGVEEGWMGCTSLSDQRAKTEGKMGNPSTGLAFISFDVGAYKGIHICRGDQ